MTKFLTMQISNWIKEGSVDFGFVNSNVSELNTIPLQEDEMVAVMPVNHPLASSTVVSLEELLKDPYILFEGVIHEPLMIFKQYDFEPDTQYRVYDPYAIMSMIEHGLGISSLPKLLLHKCPYNIVTKSISPSIIRTITCAYKDKRVLPIASRYFIDLIIERYREI
ncbi:LysR family transcriptional regulator substrate-binding protein [Peribacillus frigoritolerans]|uniref:LysR family transcriptional regulator substrate-binding protein n=1 Tax=Peribacillus frigoritolerans TaxID=450367 RepID=UPI00345D526C